MPDTIQHPDTKAIGDHRAVIARHESNVTTVVCMWCEFVMAQGPADAPLSHAFCGSARCEHLSTNPWGIVTVECLYQEARDQFARWTSARGDRAEIEHQEYRRADARFRRALKKLIEDKERGR